MKTPHAIWGAAFAYGLVRRSGLNRWHELVLGIQGHHSRLADGGTAEQTIQDFLTRHSGALGLMGSQLRDVVAKLPEKLPIVKMPDASAIERDLLIRMLFSSLIDADRLASERHGNPEGHAVASIGRILRLSGGR